MRRSPTSVAAVLAAAIAVAAPAAMARDTQSGEKELAKLLDGRVAGQPTDCIALHGGSPSSRIIDGTALVFEDGPVIYVNRPGNAQSLRSTDLITFATSLNQLCRMDIVRTVEQSTHMQTGVVDLTKFVPYRRPPKG